MTNIYTWYIFLVCAYYYVYHGGIGQAAQVCNNDIAGIESSNVCCAADCGTCGGSGCARRARRAGLTPDDCCTGLIKDADVFCDDSGTAPCIIGSGEGFGESWSAMTYFIARDNFYLHCPHVKYVMRWIIRM